MALNVAAVPAGVDPVELVRRYEPVIRFTAGELFFPMAVDAYVRHSALWRRTAGQGERQRLVDHGDLDLDVLCAHARTDVAATLELRYVPGALSPSELRRWRRDPDRARFRSTTRFAAVGLLGRIIDSLFRLSLILRGSVPGGLTAALHRRYRGSAAATNFPYYAHVSSRGGYVVLQYWFFYAMNDWRSTFGGVNDHEADWEQVTVFLVPRDEAQEPAKSPDGADVLRVGWIAFSSHDEAGDDLRQALRTTPTSAGSSTPTRGLCRRRIAFRGLPPGEYLVQWNRLLRRFSPLSGRPRGPLPWTRDPRPRGWHSLHRLQTRRRGRRSGRAAARMDPVLITRNTMGPRLRGLWGLDTDDPFGGERHRPDHATSATGRPTVLGRPRGLGRAGQSPASTAEYYRAVDDRLSTLDQQSAALTAELASADAVLAQLSVTVSALPPTLAGSRRGGTAATRQLHEQETASAELRASQRAVEIEHEHLSLARQQPPPVAGVHAHLRRRALPNVDTDRPPGLLLRFWTEVSLSVLLALAGSALVFGTFSSILVGVAAVLIVMTVEAVLRRRVVAFLLGLGVLAAIAGVGFLLVTSLRAAVGALLLIAAAVLLVANVRAYLSRR